MPSVVHTLSLAYGCAVRCRNALFDFGARSVERAPVFVVSVGALSVGGAGKTPFVQMLARLCRERIAEVNPVAIVSRGYRRRSSGSVIVSDGRGYMIDDPWQSGDEALFHARALPESPVVVARRRFRACRIAAEKLGAQCVIVDDGFQHRVLARDMNICLLDARTLASEALLPAGVLREPYSALRRADVLCFVPKMPPQSHAVWSFAPQSALRLVVEMRNGVICDGASREPLRIERNALAVCGVAQPERFAESLRAVSAPIAGALVFPDHCRYGGADVQRIIAAAERLGARDIVVTDKDYVKLAAHEKLWRARGLRLAVLPLFCVLSQADEDALCQELRRRFFARLAEIKEIKLKGAKVHM
jgi:tetraacyldisaccharide 4'-kinase